MDLDIQVGDRVTFHYVDNDETMIWIVTTKEEADDFFNTKETLKIERIGENGWCTVYEKKDLLTDEEKEFLKDIIKYYDNISQIKFREEIINLCDEDSYVMCSLDYPDNMKFENIKKVEFYTLKDLGLEEEDE